MEAPVALLCCLGKAALNALGAGVAGDLMFDVGPSVVRDVWTWWKQQDATSQRKAIEGLTRLPGETVGKVVDEVIRREGAGYPPEVRERAAAYLAAVPGAVQRSLLSKADPTGRTLPPNFTFGRPEDLLQFIPTRAPRFVAGQRPLAGWIFGWKSCLAPEDSGKSGWHETRN